MRIYNETLTFMRDTLGANTELKIIAAVKIKLNIKLNIIMKMSAGMKPNSGTGINVGWHKDRK